MRRKIFTLGTFLLMCVALVSVGFAAWIISGDAKDQATGNIQTDTVVDKSYSISKLTVQGKQDIVFAAPSNATQGWLTSDGTKTENLTVTFTATVKQGNGVVDFTSDTTEDNKLQTTTTLVTAEVKAENANFKDAVTKNLVTDPTVTITGDASGVITVTVSVAWGTAFEGKNPYTYYNALPQAENQAKAIENLNVLAALSNVTYNLSVSVTAAK